MRVERKELIKCDFCGSECENGSEKSKEFIEICFKYRTHTISHDLCENCEHKFDILIKDFKNKSVVDASSIDYEIGD